MNSRTGQYDERRRIVSHVGIVAKGGFRSPGAAIAIGLAVCAAGAFWIFVSVSRARWSQRLRATGRCGKGHNARPISRTGYFMMGLSWFLGGSVLAAAAWWPTFESLAMPWLFVVAICAPLIASPVIESVRRSRSGRDRQQGD